MYGDRTQKMFSPGSRDPFPVSSVHPNIHLWPSLCFFPGVLLENFPVCKELLIPPGTQNYVVRMRLYDANKRLLCLTIRIVLRAQGALKILISAPYWLINKTGMELFLIFVFFSLKLCYCREKTSGFPDFRMLDNGSGPRIMGIFVIFVYICLLCKMPQRSSKSGWIRVFLKRCHLFYPHFHMAQLSFLITHKSFNISTWGTNKQLKTRKKGFHF